MGTCTTENNKKISNLLMKSKEEEQKLLEQYNMTEEQFRSDMEHVKNWIDKTYDLPEGFITDNRLKFLLLNGKMSTQRAKQTIEGYLKLRTKYADFFDKLVPDSEEFKEAKKYVASASLPKLTPDLCRIMIHKFDDPEGDASSALLYYILPLMIGELMIHHDSYMSTVIISDMKNYTLKTFLKFNANVCQQLANMLRMVQFRIKEIHAINAPPIIDAVVGVMKSLIPGKIMSKVIIHKDVESLYEYVPKELLPADYGGQQKPLHELYEEWCQEIVQSEEIFKLLQKAKVDKLLIDDAPVKDMFGTDGSFKKLCVD